MPTYQIIAYPEGRRKVVAILPSDYNSSPEGVIARAAVHARLRGEYVDIEGSDGRYIGCCDGAGIVPPYGVTEFRSYPDGV